MTSTTRGADHGATWTTDRRDRLATLCAEGAPGEVIALRLGVTRNEVIGQAMRMRVRLPSRAVTETG